VYAVIVSKRGIYVQEPVSAGSLQRPPHQHRAKARSWLRQWHAPLGRLRRPRKRGSGRTTAFTAQPKVSGRGLSSVFEYLSRPCCLWEYGYHIWIAFVAGGPGACSSSTGRGRRRVWCQGVPLIMPLLKMLLIHTQYQWIKVCMSIILAVFPCIFICVHDSEKSVDCWNI
jgi:hypothetical protein